MANVLFKRGLHADLLTMSAANKIDGCFYLTTDTNRLFVGQSNGTSVDLVELNKSITTVNSINDLPGAGEVEVGQFYYIKGNGGANGNKKDPSQGSVGNILAVCVGFKGNGDPEWVQVNPDTNTDTGYEYFEKGANTGMVVSAGTVDSTNNRIKYTITLHPKKTGVDGSSSTSTLTDITADFYVNASDIGNIVNATAVAVGSSAVSSNSTTINTSGNGASGSGFTVTGGTNVTLSGSANALTIAADDHTYALSSPADNSDAKVTLTPSLNGTAQTAENVYFKAGTDLTVSGATAGEITYAHATYNAPTVNNTGLATDDSAYANNVKSFNVVDSITTSNGHVTAVTKKKVTVQDTTYTPGAISYDTSTKTLSASLTNDVTNTASTFSGANLLFHKITVDGTEVTKYNQESLGSFYSAAQVDSKINSLNAMTYKGKVGAAADGSDVTALPTIPATASDSTIKVGDTYLVVTDGTYGGQSAKVGDLLIATGTETNGVITSNLGWTAVAAGERDTTYDFQVTTVSSNPALQYKPSTSNSWTTIADINAGTALTASVSNGTITINHDASGVTAGTKGDNTTGTLSYGGSIVVPKVTVDAQGHVTGLTEATLTLPASDDTTYSISAAEANSEATITLTPSSGSATTAPIIGDGTSISTAVPSSGTNSGKVVITHSNLLSTGTAGTTYGSSASTTPASGTGVIKVPNVVVNAQGHVTSISEQSITLPADNDTHYSISNPTVSVSNNVATAQLQLANDQNSTTTSANLQVSSSSLTVAAGTNTNEIAVDIVWGTF